MKRYHLTTAAALVGLGLLCGCASTNNACGEREGLFSRWFGRSPHNDCQCVETGRVTINEGPVLPDPGYGTPGLIAPGFPTMPPPAALPVPNPLAQPTEAKPSSATKDVVK
jgi:hypothetical protein